MSYRFYELNDGSDLDDWNVLLADNEERGEISARLAYYERDR